MHQKLIPVPEHCSDFMKCTHLMALSALSCPRSVLIMTMSSHRVMSASMPVTQRTEDALSSLYLPTLLHPPHPRHHWYALCLRAGLITCLCCRSEGGNPFSRGAYCLGKIVWGKGWEELIALLSQHTEARCQVLSEPLDIYGTGEAASEV